MTDLTSPDQYRFWTEERVRFADLDALTDGGFAPIQHELRFVQAVGLVAQRTGRPLPADAGGRLLLGDQPLHTVAFPGAKTCPPPADLSVSGGPDVSPSR